MMETSIVHGREEEREVGSYQLYRQQPLILMQLANQTTLERFHTTPIMNRSQRIVSHFNISQKASSHYPAIASWNITLYGKYNK